jgi:hypothetical protein
LQSFITVHFTKSKTKYKLQDVAYYLNSRNLLWIPLSTISCTVILMIYGLINMILLSIWICLQDSKKTKETKKQAISLRWTELWLLFTFFPPERQSKRNWSKKNIFVILFFRYCNKILVFLKECIKICTFWSRKN